MSSKQNGKIKTNGATKWEQMEEMGHPSIAGENIKCYSHFGKQFDKLLHI